MKFSIWRVLRNIFLIVAVLVVGFTAFLLCTGTHSFAVQSESMAPMLHRGDMVCVRAVDFGELHEGDVVSARFPQTDGIFTHRIVSIDAEKRQITTRGDGNYNDDPLPTDEARIIGKYWFSVPYVGFISLLVQNNNTLLYILLGIALALIVVRVVLSMRRKNKG